MNHKETNNNYVSQQDISNLISKEDLKRSNDFLHSEIKRTRKEFENELSDIVGKKELDEFKRFAFKGRMLEMAVAFILGASFRKVVTSISDKLVMPFINYITNHTGSDWREAKYTIVENLVIEIGPFVGDLVDFLITAIILYIIYKKFIGPIFEEEDNVRNKNQGNQDN